MGGLQLPPAWFRELEVAVTTEGELPAWLIEKARAVWGLDLHGQSAADTVLVRPSPSLGFSRATWEINQGCNFNCEHCYLAQRKFEGLDWEGKKRLLDIVRDSGALWFQFTGGEPTADRDFHRAWEYAFRLGMLLEVLTNGSRLHSPEVIGLLRTHPPQKVVVSLYGASKETAEAVTRTPKAFDLVVKGLEAARAAGINVEIALVVTKANIHEIDAMRGIARQYARSYKEYKSISPTYDGQPDPLATQALGESDRAEVFTGCPAGHTFFHADPWGRATMCKVGRENPIDLMREGVFGLRALPGISDAQMLRTGGCQGCKLSGTCRVCRPMAKAFQAAKAPLESYCQHRRKEAPA
ncbi:radical SAM protein [Streptomyces uncialis]|uniref:radical SAM protein n=1 Tax=Streptomyces uncialis TaxID=1048205 RepID=UPI001FE8F381|nr:radical SAM protein [Streptomyces uncialis]